MTNLRVLRSISSLLIGPLWALVVAAVAEVRQPAIYYREAEEIRITFSQQGIVTEHDIRLRRSPYGAMDAPIGIGWSAMVNIWPFHQSDGHQGVRPEPSDIVIAGQGFVPGRIVWVAKDTCDSFDQKSGSGYYMVELAFESHPPSILHMKARYTLHPMASTGGVYQICPVFENLAHLPAIVLEQWTSFRISVDQPSGRSISVTQGGTPLSSGRLEGKNYYFFGAKGLVQIREY